MGLRNMSAPGEVDLMNRSGTEESTLVSAESEVLGKRGAFCHQHS